MSSGCAPSDCITRTLLSLEESTVSPRCLSLNMTCICESYAVAKRLLAYRHTVDIEVMFLLGSNRGWYRSSALLQWPIILDERHPDHKSFISHVSLMSLSKYCHTVDSSSHFGSQAHSCHFLFVLRFFGPTRIEYSWQHARMLLPVSRIML